VGEKGTDVLANAQTDIHIGRLMPQDENGGNQVASLEKHYFCV